MPIALKKSSLFVCLKWSFARMELFIEQICKQIALSNYGMQLLHNPGQ
jgi:hypothetical protein